VPQGQNLESLRPLRLDLGDEGTAAMATLDEARERDVVFHAAVPLALRPSKTGFTR
jgi:hypothetical protein